MRWYEKLYVGEKAKEDRPKIIEAVRNGKRSGYYVLTPAANMTDLFDLIPALSFSQPIYQQRDYLIVGVAADYDDAAELSGRIVSEIYRETGGFDVASFFMKE